MSKEPGRIKEKCQYCDGRGYNWITEIASLRNKTGLTQIEVADKLGYTRTSISNIERGLQQPPFDKILELATLYGCTPEDVFRAILASNKGQ